MHSVLSLFEKLLLFAVLHILRFIIFKLFDCVFLFYSVSDLISSYVLLVRHLTELESLLVVVTANVTISIPSCPSSTGSIVRIGAVACADTTRGDGLPHDRAYV